MFHVEHLLGAPGLVFLFCIRERRVFRDLRGGVLTVPVRP